MISIWRRNSKDEAFAFFYLNFLGEIEDFSLCWEKTKTHFVVLFFAAKMLCFVALSLVTLIVACVNIQLLRLGLVNIMTDGETYLKERTDTFVLIPLVVSSIECFICLLSLSVGIRLSHDAAHRKFRRKEGAFFVQILSEKEIVVVSKAPSSKQSASAYDSVHSLDWENSKSTFNKNLIFFFCRRIFFYETFHFQIENFSDSFASWKIRTETFFSILSHRNVVGL